MEENRSMIFWTLLIVFFFLMFAIGELFDGSSIKKSGKNDEKDRIKNELASKELRELTESKRLAMQRRKELNAKLKADLEILSAELGLSPDFQPLVKKDDLGPQELSGKIGDVAANSNLVSDQIQLIIPSLSKRQEIENFVKERKIEYLVHFTRLENLSSLLKHGLLGRTSLEVMNVPALMNDKLRLDKVDDAVSASITFPNYKMFFSLQQQFPNVDWVVLKLNPSILWSTECAFCFTNAAANSMTEISVDQRMDFSAFKQMFDDFAEPRTRSNLLIPDNYTTDPQAEILLLERIDPNHIISVCAKHRKKIRNYNFLSRTMLPYADSIELIHDDNLFGPRMDYAFWTKESLKSNSVGSEFDLKNFN